ncbi:MAG: hypothetical protein PHY12_07470 [Eubacteriales bacterium]|nr:hypothetical protein [Eubacteriales bacterium]
MADTLYRRSAAGVEAFYPETVAEHVRYGAGTLRSALDALTWHEIWSGEWTDFSAPLTLPMEALDGYAFALTLDVGAAMAYAARDADGNLTLRYLLTVMESGAPALYHGELTLDYETRQLTGAGWRTALIGGATEAHEKISAIAVMATSREELESLLEALTLSELSSILAGTIPGASEEDGLTQTALAGLLAGGAGTSEPNGLSQTELGGLLT